MLVAGCGVRHPTLSDGRLRFTALADGTVRDEATGLVWAGNGNLPGFREAFEGATWDEAEAFVAGMNRGERRNFGHVDWRLPSATELGALFTAFWVRRPWLACQLAGLGSGCTKLAPFEPFVDLKPGAYWSATAVRDREGRVWAVETTRRIALRSTRDTPRRVLPVRGGAPRAPTVEATPRPRAPTGALSSNPPIFPAW